MKLPQLSDYPKLPPFELPERCSIEVGHVFDGLLGGRYSVQRKLGEGSFGKVLLVEGKTVGTGSPPRKYALKLLKLWEVAYLRPKEEIHNRFIREFLITQIKDDHLVPSFDYGQLQGNPWFTMEFCEGGGMDNPQNSLVNAQLNKVNTAARQILLGLKTLHERGLVHRDIKPQNILKSAEGRIKLADFGISGDKNNRMTVKNMFGKAESLFGTYAYIAPEQSNNQHSYKALDAVADIFSFGITMYELLIGPQQYPYPPPLVNDGDLANYQKNKVEGRWHNLDENRHLLPGEWYYIIKKSIDPDYKKQRFKNVDEILSLIGPYSLTPKQPEYDPKKNNLLLRVTYGAQIGVTYNLSELAGQDRRSALITMGRKDLNVSNGVEIMEEDPVYISRRHCTIEKRSMAGAQQWWLRDGQLVDGQWQRSVNKTYVNSHEVDHIGQALYTGDLIAIGDTRLQLIAS